jgi:AmmeMemoRadiSam system protein B
MGAVSRGRREKSLLGVRGLKASFETPSDGVADMPAWAGDIKGIISPHIDFPRGGPVYGRVWATAAPAVKEAELIVILGTDHNGGEGEITLTRQSYETPWGIVPTDQEVVNKIAALAGEDAVFGGELRHRGEHSVEAALIWAHYLMKDRPCRVVPILCGSFESFIHQNISPSQGRSTAATIEVLRETANKRRTIIVAAADLAHVGPAFGDLLPLDLAARARLEVQDRRLIGILGKADPGAFFEEIRGDGDQRRICGIPPIFIALSVLSGLAGSPAGYAQPGQRGRHVDRLNMRDGVPLIQDIRPVRKIGTMLWCAHFETALRSFFTTTARSASFAIWRFRFFQALGQSL